MTPRCVANARRQGRDPCRHPSACCAESLPNLLLRQGSMEGPYRRTQPETRWRWMLRQLARFLVAPRARL